MKKHLKLTALLSAAVLLLCACNTSESDSESGGQSELSSTSQTESTTTSSSTTSISENSAPVNDPDTKGLPRMDGSTSAIPLEIGLKSGFLGIPYNEAKKLVSHTTTHDSFKRLINGEVDLIFSVPISEEQQKLADDAGVKLFMKPVAREGFVFAVNVNNPVDSLTSEQIRKIYSGEITNWSQVGGNDEAILPYQRNKDSGSQNYMTVFMGDTPLVEPKVDFVKGGMGGLMDAIAVYDNSAGAIGYSVYSYAAQMYASANKVKFIAVDGVAPSKATMADESYPLLSCTYMIYTDKSPESAKEFAAKALSDEGQNYVLESGYLPVNGMDIPEKHLPYEAVGTGEPKPADFKPSDKYSYIWLGIKSDYSPHLDIIPDGEYFKLDLLKDKALQDRINSDIRAAMDSLSGYELPQAEKEYRERNSVHSANSSGISIEAVCRNGYLSIVVGYLNMHDSGIDGTFYYKVETLNYDLFSGKKLEKYSDLFYEGENFLPDVSAALALESAKYEYLKKSDFYGILGEPKLFTIDGIFFEPDNVYFTDGLLLEYDDIFNFHSVVTQYRDMRSIVTEDNVDDVMDLSCNNEWKETYTEENGEVFLRYVGSPFHTAEEVKARDEFWYELQKQAWSEIEKLDPNWHSRHTAILLREYENYYSAGHFSSDMADEPQVMFDKETMEIITPEMLIGENWREYSIYNYNAPDGGSYIVSGNIWHAEGTDIVDVVVFGKGFWTILNVPPEKLNKRYYTPLT